MKMGLGFKVERIWAVVAHFGPDDESVPVLKASSPHTLKPGVLFTVDPDQVERLKGMAAQFTRDTGFPTSVACFRRETD